MYSYSELLIIMQLCENALHTLGTSIFYSSQWNETVRNLKYVASLIIDAINNKKQKHTPDLLDILNYKFQKELIMPLAKLTAEFHLFEIDMFLVYYYRNFLLGKCSKFDISQKDIFVRSDKIISSDYAACTMSILMENTNFHGAKLNKSMLIIFALQNFLQRFQFKSISATNIVEVSAPVPDIEIEIVEIGKEIYYSCEERSSLFKALHPLYLHRKFEAVDVVDCYFQIKKIPMSIPGIIKLLQIFAIGYLPFVTKMIQKKQRLLRRCTLQARQEMQVNHDFVEPKKIAEIFSECSACLHSLSTSFFYSSGWNNRVEEIKNMFKNIKCAMNEVSVSYVPFLDTGSIRLQTKKPKGVLLQKVMKRFHKNIIFLMGELLGKYGRVKAVENFLLYYCDAYMNLLCFRFDVSIQDLHTDRAWIVYQKEVDDFLSLCGVEKYLTNDSVKERQSLFFFSLFSFVKNAQLEPPKDTIDFQHQDKLISVSSNIPHDVLIKTVLHLLSWLFFKFDYEYEKDIVRQQENVSNEIQLQTIKNSLLWQSDDDSDYDLKNECISDEKHSKAHI